MRARHEAEKAEFNKRAWQRLVADGGGDTAALKAELDAEQDAMTKRQDDEIALSWRSDDPQGISDGELDVVPLHRDALDQEIAGILAPSSNPFPQRDQATTELLQRLAAEDEAALRDESNSYPTADSRRPDAALADVILSLYFVRPVEEVPTSLFDHLLDEVLGVPPEPDAGFSDRGGSAAGDLPRDERNAGTNDSPGDEAKSTAHPPVAQILGQPGASLGVERRIEGNPGARLDLGRRQTTPIPDALAGRTVRTPGAPKPIEVLGNPGDSGLGALLGRGPSCGGPASALGVGLPGGALVSGSSTCGMPGAGPKVDASTARQTALAPGLNLSTSGAVSSSPSVGVPESGAGAGAGAPAPEGGPPHTGGEENSGIQGQDGRVLADQALTEAGITSRSDRLAARDGKNALDDAAAAQDAADRQKTSDDQSADDLARQEALTNAALEEFERHKELGLAETAERDRLAEQERIAEAERQTQEEEERDAPPPPLPATQPTPAYTYRAEHDHPVDGEDDMPSYVPPSGAETDVGPAGGGEQVEETKDEPPPDTSNLPDPGDGWVPSGSPTPAPFSLSDSSASIDV